MQWTLGDAHVDLGQRSVRWPDRTVDLTAQEVELLRFLALSHGRAVERDVLLERVWGYAPNTRTRAVDHAIHRLRVKIEVDPDAPRFLQTVRGLGYRLALEAPTAPRAEMVGLVGREAMLGALREAVARSSRVTVVGPAGIGKTTLVRAWAAEAGVPVIDLSGVDADGVPAALAAAVDVPIAPGAAGRLAIDRVGRALAGRGHRQVVIDDVSRADGPVVSATVDAWNGVGVRTVVTSQLPLGIGGEHLFTVGPLSDPHTAELLERESGADRLPRGRELDTLVAHLGGHPLSIVLASAHLRRLRAQAVLELLAGGAEVATAAVGAGIAGLPPGCVDTLYALALAPGLPLSAVQAATGHPMRTLQRHLERLHDSALVGQGPVVVELVRVAVLAQRRGAIEARLADHLLATGEDGPVVPMLAQRLGAEDPSRAARLWLAVGRPMLLRGPAQLEWIDQAVMLGTGLERAEAHVVRAAVRTLVGDLEGARADLDAAEPHATGRLAIEVRMRRGWLALFEGELTTAEQCLRDARARARREAEPDLEAATEVRLASVRHRQGDAGAAVRHLQGALGLYEGLGDRTQTARTRSNLAMMHVELGAHRDARRALEAALESDREAGIWAAVPQHLLNLAGLHLDLGELEDARRRLAEARERAVHFGDTETEGLALLSGGIVDLLDGRSGAALVQLTRGRTLLQQANNRSTAGIAWAYCALANACAGDPGEGASCLAEARHLLQPANLAALDALLEIVDATLALASGGSSGVSRESRYGTDGPDPSEASASLSFVRIAQRVYAAERARRVRSAPTR
ncbi:MAG: winged helix-turn-helix domain-containing protein [Myxococcota bacterium]